MQTFEFGEIAHQGECPNCGVNEEDLLKKRIMANDKWKKEFKDFEKRMEEEDED
jgi:hypothetical protein